MQETKAMGFSRELLDKAKTCQTAEELIALAKDNELDLSPEEAEALLREFEEEGELADEELGNVAGGAEGCASADAFFKDVYWDREEDVQFLFNIGDHVKTFTRYRRDHVLPCTVVNRSAQDDGSGKWADYYWLKREIPVPFGPRWFQRHHISL